MVPTSMSLKKTKQVLILDNLEYIQKYSLSMMRDSINDQISKFLEGFYEVLPKECISFFEAKEL